MSKRLPATHRQLPFSIRLAALFLLFKLVGCSTVLTSPPVDYPSLLRSVETTPDSVTLEILQVRVPANEPMLSKDIWQAIDEQRLDLDMRHELTKNGFRAGVLGSTLPNELARQLNLQSEMPEMSPERVITAANANPRVTRRVVQLSQHEPALIKASQVQPEVVVMLTEDGGVRGKRYQEVEAVYSMHAQQVPGQRVSLKLTPELRHGELRPRYSGSSDQGIFLMMSTREREAFDHLKLTTELAPGEVLVVSCRAEEEGSLGHTFHGVDSDGPLEQKLVLIRLLQVPSSEILADVE